MSDSSDFEKKLDEQIAQLSASIRKKFEARRKKIQLEYRKLKSTKEKRRLGQIEYRKRPEIKAKRKEYDKKRDRNLIRSVRRI